jgi:hypothetical protein
MAFSDKTKWRSETKQNGVALFQIFVICVLNRHLVMSQIYWKSSGIPRQNNVGYNFSKVQMFIGE